MPGTSYNGAAPAPAASVMDSRISSSKPTLLSFEEPAIQLSFGGRNETSKIEVDGWTRKAPLKFIKLRPDLKLKTISSRTPAGQLPITLTEMMGSRVQLKDISVRAGPNRAKMPYPVLVTVLAKKTVDVSVRDRRITMFGDMLVGDASGFCRMTAVNDSIWSVYQQVQVGDKLLVGTAAMQELYPGANFTTYICLEDHYFLPLDLKLNSYDSRYMYKLPGVGDGKLPQFYTDERKILTVTQLITPSIKECEVLHGKPDTFYFDVIGVVSHVGRVERRREFRKEVLVGEDHDDQSLEFFSCFRWIELVDQTSREPLPLIFYINSDNLDIQSSVVPGSLILITNVRKQLADIAPAYCSTRFSKMLINKGIGSYLSLFPQDSEQLIHLSREFLGDSAKLILGRPDVDWSAGGSYSRIIEDERAYAQIFLDRSQTIPRPPPAGICQKFRPDYDDKFMRRESFRFAFKGFIQKFAVMTSKMRHVFTVNTNQEMREEYNELFEEEQIKNSSSFCYPALNWYMFKRQLPRIELDSLEGKNEKNDIYPIHFYEALSVKYKKYCEPLLMPAKGDPNLLKDLPALDCFPLLMIQLVNHDVFPHEQYFCLWKESRGMPLEKMKAKLDSLVNCKSLIFSVDVHYTGEDPDLRKIMGGSMFELILQDLVALPDPEAREGAEN